MEFVFVIAGAILMVVLAVMFARNSVISAGTNNVSAAANEGMGELGALTPSPLSQTQRTPTLVPSPTACACGLNTTCPSGQGLAAACQIPCQDTLCTGCAASCLPPISSCATISSSGRYVLTSSFSSWGTCLRVTHDDVDIDCAGYTITGSGGGNGVESQNNDNVTVRNCNLTGFSDAAYFKNGNGGYVLNSTLSNSAYGVYAKDEDGLVVHNSTITGATTDGIYVSGGSGANLSFLNISTTGTASGVYLTGSANAQVTQNGFSGGGTQGVYAASGSDNANVSNNSFSLSATYGIYVSGSDTMSILNNNAMAAAFSGYSVYLASTSTTQVLDNALSATGTCRIFNCQSGSCTNTCSSGVGSCEDNLIASSNSPTPRCTH